MNYRHAFHAGNFADVFKHAILTRILLYLQRKDAAFRVIDTHAGEGAYDLAREEANRTGEWRAGIASLGTIASESAAGKLLAPFLSLVGPVDLDRPPLYPGSPLIAQHFLRKQDRAIFCETHLPAFTALERRFKRDRRIKTLALDGWTALNAFTPPPEKRGLILIDPPFERPDEFGHMAACFAKAYAKWPNGVYALWHPIKNPVEMSGFIRAIEQTGAKNILRLELGVAAQSNAGGLTRTGLLIFNPPYVLEGEARILLPALAGAMERSFGAGFSRIETFANAAP